VPQVETIPPEATAVAEMPALAEEPEATGAYRIHTVERDEDLYSVAMMWGVSVARLKEINSLSSTVLKPGQRLKIPLPE
jgi:LysM repeat protein